MFERMFFLSKHHLNWSVSVVGISEFVVEDDLFFVVFVCLCVCVCFFSISQVFSMLLYFSFLGMLGRCLFQGFRISSKIQQIFHGCQGP